MGRAPKKAEGGLSRRRAKEENVVRVPRLFGTYLRFRSWLYHVLNSDHTFVNEYRLIGQHGAKYLNSFIPKRQLAKIDALKNGSNTYAHIKNLPTIGLFFPHPPDALFRDISETGQRKLQRSFGLRFFHTEMMIAGLANVLGTHIRRRYEQTHQAVGRDLRTAPDEPQVGDRDGSDMALRFHQSTVEFQLPLDTADQGPGHESCRYKIYVGVKNRREIPLFLIPVKEVIANIHPEDEAKREAVLAELKLEQFRKQGPTWDVTSRAEAVTGEILQEIVGADGQKDWYLCFDPERVRAFDTARVEAHNAVRQLRAALIRCRPTAIRLVVERGDVLIVDNQRALVSRREYYPISVPDIVRSIFFRRPRWIRLYYAFRAPASQIVRQGNHEKGKLVSGAATANADERLVE